jgi:hypothetical protein
MQCPLGGACLILLIRRPANMMNVAILFRWKHCGARMVIESA